MNRWKIVSLMLGVMLLYGVHDCWAVVPREGAPVLCYLKNDDQKCVERMGMDLTDPIDACDQSCTGPGNNCSADDYKSPNTALTPQQYDKNRATGITLTTGSGFAQNTPNFIQCGTIGVCDKPCEAIEEEEQTIWVCRPRILADDNGGGGMAFFDLEHPCPAPPGPPAP